MSPLLLPILTYPISETHRLIPVIIPSSGGVETHTRRKAMAEERVQYWCRNVLPGGPFRPLGWGQDDPL